jgi:outer membrane lipoprotein SlyB
MQSAAKLHPLVATAAIAVTAVSALAGVAIVRDEVAARHVASPEAQVAQIAQASSPEPVPPIVAAPPAPAQAAPAPKPAPKPVIKPAPRPAPAPVAEAPQTLPPIDPPARGTLPVYTPAPVAVCHDCGVVSAVREVKTPGQAQGLGAVGGAVVGGVIGNQIGKGNGRDAARILGAIGGAVAGHQIEKQARANVRYDVDVRMDDGSLRTVSMTSAPDLRAGDAVRVDGNGLRLAHGGAVPTRPAPQSQYAADRSGGA